MWRILMDLSPSLRGRPGSWLGKLCQSQYWSICVFAGQRCPRRHRPRWNIPLLGEASSVSSPSTVPSSPKQARRERLCVKIAGRRHRIRLSQTPNCSSRWPGGILLAPRPRFLLAVFTAGTGNTRRPPYLAAQASTSVLKWLFSPSNVCRDVCWRHLTPL